MAAYVHGVRDGSVAERLNLPTIRALPVLAPELSEQRAIAAILGVLDDKIELNRKMSATLEAIARALFKSWFVDFDPVRAKAEGRDPGLPAEIAARFPDSFEETAHGQIPSGWRVGALGEVARNIRNGISHNDILEGTPYIGLEHMPRRSIALDRWGHAFQLESNKSEFQQGNILFGKLRPYFHKVGIAPVDGVCSTDILVVSETSADWSAFVLMHLSSDALVTHTDRCSTGTKMPRASWDHIGTYEVALPPLEIARLLTAAISPMTGRIIAGIHESRTLAALRDALLPKLISGELRVGDAERVLAASA
jgi:type I restriction enzyme S subunit